MATIGGLRGRFFHNGQFIKKCKLCDGPPHAPGKKCPAANEDEDTITAFSNHQIVLSNLHECELTTTGKKFHSVQQIWLWRKALAFEKNELADNLLESRHAGHASQMASEIMNGENYDAWEHSNTELMLQLLRLKADQYMPFKTALLEDKTQ